MSQYQQSRLLLGQPAVNYHSPVKIGAVAVPLEHSVTAAASGSNSPLVRPIARMHSPHSPSASSQPSGNNSPKPLSINAAHRYADPQPLSPGHIAQQQLIGQQQQQAAQQMAAAQQLGALPQLPSLPFASNPYLSDLSGVSAASSPKLSNHSDESPLPQLPVAGSMSANAFSSSPDVLGRSLLPGGQSYMGLPSVGTPPPQSANPYSNFFFPPLMTGTSPSTTAPGSPNLHNAQQNSMFGFGRNSGGNPGGSGPSPPSSAASGAGSNPFASMMLPWQQLMTAGGQSALQQMSAMNNMGMSAALQQQMAAMPLKFTNPFMPALPGSPSMGYNSIFNQPHNGGNGAAGGGNAASGAGGGGAAQANLFAGMSSFDFPGMNPANFADPISRINSPSLDGTSTPPPHRCCRHQPAGRL